MFPIVIQGSSDLASSEKTSCKNGKLHLCFKVLEIISYHKVQNNRTAILDLLPLWGSNFNKLNLKRG